MLFVCTGCQLRFQSVSIRTQREQSFVNMGTIRTSLKLLSHAVGEAAMLLNNLDQDHH